MKRFTPKQIKEIKKLAAAMALFAILIAAEHFAEFEHIKLLYLLPYFIAGYDVLRKCFLGIKNKQFFDENFLMSLATFGAFGCGEYEEAVAVMLFYQVGEFFQDYAVGKSRNAVSELMDIAPDYANRELDDDICETIHVEDIIPGDILIVKPGEKIPTDAIVIEGHGLINTSALTGESLPREVKEGDSVMSGCINGDSLLRVQALTEYDYSTVMQILELVENAASKKSKTESFITRFAKYYTPVVVIAALLLAFIPPILTGNFAGEFGSWLLRACTFLVISCPCALVISVPLSFFGGIGAASREGVLVKGSNYLELLARLDTVVTDKTGTLTEGRFGVSYIEAAKGYDTEKVIRYAAAAESGSTHPIATAITEACIKPFPQNRIRDIEITAGKGIRALVGGEKILVGNLSYMEDAGINVPINNEYAFGTCCYVSKNGKYIGTIVVSDKPKKSAKTAITDMLKLGVRRIVMLTGDSEIVAKEVAAELGIDEYQAELLPQDKVSAVERLIGEMREFKGDKGRLAFIGDGVNDAPVLSIADLGIAMGSLGSYAAIEAADVVIMDDELARIPRVMRIARRTLGISRANIIFALTVKFACLALGAVGIANMWAAVFADVGVAVICILNSMRMLIKDEK
ncbi:MAG: cadmium-translocating P-type ATPase [Mogibacterium sp.]|nr:cadmium-translocating P-type ATPase [Mogibacterium sp.]